MEKHQDVWRPETGITDFEIDSSQLAIDESARIRTEWAARRAELGDTDRLRLFTEQLSREWAIETGIIENLYYIDRGVTLTFIERGFQEALLQHGSFDKDPKYIIALLEDQKLALENLFAFVKQDRALSTGYIKELHALMTQSQQVTEAFTPAGEKIEVPLIKGDWKRDPNFPFRDGVQYRYCPPEQTASEMDRLIEMHQRHLDRGVAPEVEGAWIHHRFTQIHPFQDGNGRVARALASLVLIRSGMFPLIIPREEKTIYLRTLEKADSGSLAPLCRLVGRRQEVAFQKANDLLLKLAPEPETLEDAATRVGLLYSRQSGVIAERLEQRIGELHAWVYGETQNHARKATSALRRAAGIEEFIGGGFGGGGFSSPAPGPNLEVVGANAKDQFFAAAREALLERWSTIIGRPTDAFILKVNLAVSSEFVIHLHATNPESDESVQIALLQAGPPLAAVDIVPLTWSPGEAKGAFQAKVGPWVEQAIRKALALVARQT